MPIVRQLRLHQWVKNLLLFVPVILAHRLQDMDAMFNVVVAFFAFGLCASAIYTLNDITDVESDKQHPSKRKRPIASGQLSIAQASALAAVLLIVSAVIAFFWTPPEFAIWLVVYVLATTAYSFFLKRIVLVDVLVLALLYVLRVEAGAEAAGVVVSPWLLAFSLFMFTSLAFLKRYTELRLTIEHEGRIVSGRGYHVGDADFVLALGPATGLLAVLIFTLYLNGPEVQNLYLHPLRLWGVVPLLVYWISYVWLASFRGRMHDDPIIFAVRDGISYAVAGLAAGIVLWASMP